ncbi:MAG: MFS transporter [Bifidobacteriaceae bacterium]|jgi:MFS family permease|nr:MFS transporter [Bifidobacteriaceae bacterium]
MSNPLFKTMISLRGNPRACVYTEPMWGLSMNLCLPYASVYMLALGLKDAQIGLLASCGMLSQMVWGLLGGVITDKLGRRLTTAVFDVLAWSIPCLIWASASMVDRRAAFWLFLGASLVNGTWQVTQNSWDCLMVEDAERQQITGIYSLVMVAGNLSALFAPIAALMVSHFSLVPAVRILYFNAFAIMTIKLVILYFASHETEMGVIRREATRGVPMLQLLRGYRGVLGVIRRSPGTIFSLVIAALVGAVSTVNTTFWQVIASKKLLVPDALLPFFPMARSILAIGFFFFVIPRVTGDTNLKRPLLLGFGVFGASQALLALIPAPTGGAGGGGVAVAGASVYCLLALCLVLDGFGAGILAMLAESLVALNVDKEERSRVMAVQRTVIMLAVAPFGWIGGLLSGVNRSLPFVLTTVLLALGLVVTVAFYRRPPSATPAS